MGIFQARFHENFSMINCYQRKLAFRKQYIFQSTPLKEMEPVSVSQQQLNIIINYRVVNLRLTVSVTYRVVGFRFFPVAFKYIHQQDLGTSVRGFQSGDTGPHPFPKCPPFCKFDVATGRNEIAISG